MLKKRNDIEFLISGIIDVDYPNSLQIKEMNFYNSFSGINFLGFEQDVRKAIRAARLYSATIV